MIDSEGTFALICRVRTRLCALPLAQVIETMRPLPVERVSGAPDFVRGVSIIRGVPVPVVDAGRLIGADMGDPGRFVTLRVGQRRVALAVDAVLGIRDLPRKSLVDLPPLLEAAHGNVVSAIGTLDAELLLALEGARILADERLAQLDVEQRAP